MVIIIIIIYARAQSVQMLTVMYSIIGQRQNKYLLSFTVSVAAGYIGNTYITHNYVTIFIHSIIFLKLE